jgi:hypothetical protein
MIFDPSDLLKRPLSHPTFELAQASMAQAPKSQFYTCMKAKQKDLLTIVFLPKYLP